MKPFDLNDMLPEFKYKVVPLEELLNRIFSHFEFCPSEQAEETMAHLLVDYKFKVGVTLKETIAAIEKTIPPKPKFAPAYDSDAGIPRIPANPGFDLYKIVGDLKTLGILNTISNFKLLFNSATGLLPTYYIFELQSQDPNLPYLLTPPSISFKIAENPNTNSLDSDAVTSYIYSALIDIVDTSKVGITSQAVYNSLNVDIKYVEIVGRIPPYEISGFTEKINTNFLTQRFFSKP